MFVSFVAFYVLSAPRGGGLVSTFIAAVPAWLLGLLAALLGAGLRLSRFALYATFFLASGLAITVTGSEPEVAMIAAGLLTACGGLLVLVRFLRLAADGGGGS